MSNAPWCEDVKPGDILIPIPRGIGEMKIITPAVVDTIRKTWSKDVLMYSFSVKCRRESTPYLRDLGAAWFEGLEKIGNLHKTAGLLEC